MQYKVKMTVIDKKLYPELQAQDCKDPNAGACPGYNVGDEFIFERYGNADDFWHLGLNTLKQTAKTANDTAGGPNFPHCSEAWDAISRYIYTGLQGGSIMREWMQDERVMIACCSDGTRPVIFKIERIDYKVLHIDGINNDFCRQKIKNALTALTDVQDIAFKDNFTEVFLAKDVDDTALKIAVENCGQYIVTKID